MTDVLGQDALAVYPRVCGGNGHTLPDYPKPHGLSPRVRGKLFLTMRPVLRRRSIPACAGET